MRKIYPLILALIFFEFSGNAQQSFSFTSSSDAFSLRTYGTYASEEIKIISEDGIERIITIGESISIQPNKQYIVKGDFSKLSVSEKGLTSLDVSGLTNLKTLDCKTNNLTSLNISGLKNLEELFCKENQLTSLNVSGLINLSLLACEKNKLTSLDISDLTKLRVLYCLENQLTTIDVSNQTKLERLECSSNQLALLNVSNLSKLSLLACEKNRLTLLDVSNLTKLERLECSSNQLTSLNVSSLTSLERLECSSNKLSLLDMSSLARLEKLECSSNQFTSLDVSDLTNLEKLSCASNQLSSLDVSSITNLEILNCSKNKISSLDVSNLTNLWDLDCSKNQLTSLDVSSLTKIKYFYCFENKLIDIKTNEDKIPDTFEGTSQKAVVTIKKNDNGYGFTSIHKYDITEGNTFAFNSNITNVSFDNGYFKSIYLPNGEKAYSTNIGFGDNKKLSGNIIFEEELTIDLAVTQPKCFGEKGYITPNINGGTGVLKSTWTKDGVTFNGSLSGLENGHYEITVTDANNFTKTASVIIKAPEQIIIDLAVIQPKCFKEKGSIVITTNGGTGVLKSSWKKDGIDFTGSLTDLENGTYEVTVTDANGCTKTKNKTIILPEQITIDLAVTQPKCFGEKGYITTNINGGSGVLKSTWTKDGMPFTESLAGLEIGSYEVTVTDGNGCTKTSGIIITEPEQIMVDLAVIQPKTFGEKGSIVLTTNGGTGTLTSSWTKDGIAFFGSLTELESGTYEVKITDDKGCAKTVSSTITKPGEIIITLAVTQPKVFGEKGSIVITTNGGIQPLISTWTKDGVAYTGSFTEMEAGTYEVTVIDANGYTKIKTVTIESAPTEIIVDLIVTQPKCFDEKGSIVLTTNGGIEPLISTWTKDGVAYTGSLTNLESGVYQVTVTDANGYTKTKTVTIESAPTEIIVDLIVTQPKCFDEKGSIVLTANGGVGSLISTWTKDGVAYTGSLTNLESGVYQVTVTDANGYTKIEKVTIESAPAEITIGLEAIQPKCFDKKGSIVLTTNGGKGELKSTWTKDGVAYTGSLTELETGTYEMTVIDANSCIKTATANIVVPEKTTMLIDINSDNKAIAEYEIATITVKYPAEANATVEWFDDKGAKISRAVNSGNTSSITIENTPKSTKGIKVYTVKVTEACSGEVTERTIEIEFYLDPEVMVVQEDKSLLLANNNAKSNGGYKFDKFMWYISLDGNNKFELAPGVANKQTYTPNINKQTDLDLNAYYQLMAITSDGKAMRTAPFKVKDVHKYNLEFKVYPNPAQVNKEIIVENNLRPEEYKGAVIHVYSVLGIRKHSVKVEGEKTSFTISEQGVYFIHFESAVYEGSKKIIVK